MYEIKNTENIEEIDTITMYRMIQSLLNYDYFNCKCLVKAFMETRTNEKELVSLKEINQLLFKYKIKSVEELLEKIITDLLIKKKKITFI